MASLKNEQVDLENEISKLDGEQGPSEVTFEQVKNVFLQANAIASKFFTAKDDLKREYAEIALSNIWVRDQIAQHFQFKPEYQVIANLPENPTLEQLCTGQDSN